MIKNATFAILNCFELEFEVVQKLYSYMKYNNQLTIINYIFLKNGNNDSKYEFNNYLILHYKISI